MKRTSRRLIRRTVRRIIGIGYYAFGIIVSLVATGIHRLWLQITLVFAGVVFAGGAYYFDSLRRQRRVTDDKLEPLLDGVLFPLILDEYRGMVEDPPEIRVNLMLLRYRDVTPVGQERNLWPWQRSMAADFTYGDYNRRNEEMIKWCVDEGVCGTAMEYNRLIYSDLEDVQIHEWDMTPSQLNATTHLGSVLSIPVYAPDDEEKNRPLGVLNIDSRENLDETRFDEIRTKELKRYAGYIGTLV